MHSATLCLIRNGDNLLLAMKKRGFGVGKWNGVGGKPEVTDKDIAATAFRETKEEIGVEIEDFKKVAVLRFTFPYKDQKADWDQDVHVYLATSWKGEPKETEEMKPQWFNISNLPYQEMWDDDKLWLPHVLAGKKVNAEFVFEEGEIINNHIINFVEQLA